MAVLMMVLLVATIVSGAAITLVLGVTHVVWRSGTFRSHTLNSILSGRVTHTHTHGQDNTKTTATSGVVGGRWWWWWCLNWWFGKGCTVALAMP